MNPEDNEAADQNPIISSRPPFLPPATRKQALDALLSPDSLSYALIHPVQPWHEPGLAESLVQGMPQQQTPESGLAGALASHGITSLPGADPRLVNMTQDPAKPTFETGKGTVIRMNKPAPPLEVMQPGNTQSGTTLPWGAGLDRLIRFADGTGRGEVMVTGGTEGSNPNATARQHSANPLDCHHRNCAIDVAPDPRVSEDMLKKAALAAGYTHGIREVTSKGTHFHLQVGPDNIKEDPALFDLTNDGPIRTRDYTKDSTATPPQGYRP